MKNCALISLIVLLLSCGGEDLATQDLKAQDSTQIGVEINSGNHQIISPTVDDEIIALENSGIKLTEIKTKSSDASLKLITKSFKEGRNQLNFQVEGVSDYRIAYLSNNYYLSQFSNDIFEMDFMPANNVFLAFLTDKNNISIKSNTSSILKNAVIGDMENMFDMTQPHLFYYLPQSESDNPILDFYLVNTSISKNGNRVRVTINEVEFMIEKWAAYQISGLTGSKHTLRIELLDKNNQPIDGPFNDSGLRSFTFGAKVS